MKSALMKVSVVIAVYNQGKYVRQAVESALQQPETEEVLLVEDGSSDDSLKISQEIAAEYPKVRLLRHDGGVNRGYPATLNLGITNSRSEYVAFVDADDFFLPNRFAVTSRIFEADPTVDGVYETCSPYIEDETAKARWLAAGFNLEDSTIRKNVAPEQLFEALLTGKAGNFLKQGLTVKRTLFDKVGLYDEHLLLHQDTAMNFKMAALGRLVPGELNEPVTMRRIHQENRVSQPRPWRDVYAKRVLTFGSAWRWAYQHLDAPKERAMLDYFLDRTMRMSNTDTPLPLWADFFQRRLRLLGLLRDYPSLITRWAYWKRIIPGTRSVSHVLLHKITT